MWKISNNCSVIFEPNNKAKLNAYYGYAFNLFYFYLANIGT